jgi:hypothetical protein
MGRTMPGKLNFVAKVKIELGFKAARREVTFRFQRLIEAESKIQTENLK